MIGSKREGAYFGRYTFRRTAIALFLFGAAVLLTHLADAGGFQADSIRVEKPTLKAGEVRRFEAALDHRKGSPNDKLNGKSVMRFNRTVKEIKPDGSATLVITFEAIHYLVNGQESGSPDRMPVVTLTRVSTGKFTASSETGSSMATSNAAGMQNLLELTELFLPAKPVHVGDHWKFAYPLGPEKFQGLATLASIDKTPQGQILKITFTADSIPSKTPNKGWLTIDRATGTLVKFVDHQTEGTVKQPEETDIVLQALPENPKNDPK